MKKLFLILVSMFALSNIVMAETTMSEKEIAKMAKKEAKRLKKEGWTVAPGALPLENQLIRLYSKQYDVDDAEQPKYFIGQSQPIAEFYDAAVLQGMTLAKLDIADKISSQLKGVIEAELGNKQLPQKEAVSVAQVTAKMSEAVQAKLGNVTPLLQCVKELPNGNVQMMMQVSYPSVAALQEAKEAIRAKLEAEIKGLGEKLDSLK